MIVLITLIDIKLLVAIIGKDIYKNRKKKNK